MSIFIFLLLTVVNTLNGQGQGVKRISEITSGKPNSQVVYLQTQSIKIEEGKVWINGKLLSQNNLPSSLRHVNSSMRVNISLCCDMPAHTFTLNGVEYVFRDGKIIEVLPVGYRAVSVRNEDNLTRYFQDMKSQDPRTFDNMTKEAQLEILSQRLAQQFAKVKSNKDRQEIEDQMRLVLDEIFTLKQENIRKEIINLQSSIHQLEGEIMQREKLRLEIIEKRIQELIRQYALSRW